jgi:hypothetical protein
MAVDQRRLSSTGFGVEAGCKMLILARSSSSNPAISAARPRIDGKASDRGSCGPQPGLRRDLSGFARRSRP